MGFDNYILSSSTVLLSFSIQISLGGQRVGQRSGLSTTDVDKLWTLYQCYGGGQYCSKAARVDTMIMAYIVIPCIWFKNLENIL